ncbi:hypothetical protein [Lysinibacillus sp. TE18511]
MKKTTKELFNVLEEFSKIFNIPPPWSNDIGSWWQQVVNDMEIELLYLLHNNNVLGCYDNDVLIFMNDVLFNRVIDLNKVKH